MNDPGVSAAGSTNDGKLVAAGKRALIGLGPTVAGIALLVALSARRYLPLANADALLPALMSTQKLTFYYWGQDRLANVVPAIAWPIRDPIWNFRFQMLVYASGFFALVAMFVWFHLHATKRRATGLPLAVASTVAGLLVLFPMRRGTGYAFVFEQVYALSLALFLPGVRLLVDGSSSRSRRAMGTLLVLLAVLLNPSVVLISPAMWLLDDEPLGRQRRFADALGAILGAFVVYAISSRLWASGPGQRQYYDNFSLADIGEALDTTVSRILGSLQLATASVVGVICVALIAVRWRFWPVRLRVCYACAPIFGLGWVVVFAANEWVSINVYSYRYFFPLYAAGMLLVSAAVAEAVTLISGALAGRRTARPIGSKVQTTLAGAAVVATIVVAVVALANTEVRSLESAATNVDTARRLDLPLVTGDYWSTWPVVVAGRSAGLDLLGVTDRSDPIVDDIRAEVRRTMDSKGVVRALCPSLELDRCASELSVWTGRSWSASHVDMSDPTVIELHPIP